MPVMLIINLSAATLIRRLLIHNAVRVCKLEERCVKYKSDLIEMTEIPIT